ncbi:MAG: DJ-1/PfpI family protein [Acidobacteria bacterium]|nr:DJ-1/PfpI family protein [Acidobacteriota bacterium]
MSSVATAPARNVAILIFDEVEVLDFCGPFEVFSITGKRDNATPFNVYTVAESSRPVLARNALSVNPHYTINDCPRPDILIVPGGFGTRALLNHAPIIEWIAARAAEAELVLSVCTGSLLLAKAGLLEGLAATTHWGALDLLRELAPHTTVRSDQQYVDNGRILTSAGISAGIDLSLYVVAKLFGAAQAAETAHYMEYKHWKGPSA